MAGGCTVSWPPGLILLLNTLLALPSVVVGLIVYPAVSRSGPLGSWGILFTPTAMVIAQTILVLPVVAALTAAFVGDTLRDGGDQLRSMGGPMACALLMPGPDRWAVLTTVLIAAFGRAIASPARSDDRRRQHRRRHARDDDLDRASRRAKGDLPLAMALGIVLLGVVVVAQPRHRLGAGFARRWRARVTHDAERCDERTDERPLVARAPARRARCLRLCVLAPEAGVDPDDCSAASSSLVGANGSGKTTLLRALHGLVRIEGARELADPRRAVRR